MTTVRKPPNLEETYKVALDSVVKLENVDMAMIYVVDEEKREAVLKAHRNVPESYVRRAGSIPHPKGVTWKVINSGATLNLQDIQKDSAIGPAGQDLGHHSALGIPIILDEKAIGVIWFVSYKERKFNEDEVDLLSSLGNQIAVAIARTKQNQELIDSHRILKKKNQYLSRLSKISQVIHQSVGLDDVYKTFLDVVQDLKFIDLASVYLIEGKADKREAILQTHRGPSDNGFKVTQRIPYSQGVTWEVVDSGKFNYYENVSELPPRKVHVGKNLGQRALLSVPVQLDNQTIGVIHFSSLEKASFTNQELDFLISLGNQIGTAIAKAKMLGEIKQWKETLEESEQRYIALVEHTYDFICEINTDGQYLFVSPKYKNLLGYDPGDLLGRSMFEHIHPDDRPVVVTEFAKAVKTFTSGQAVFRYRNKNGEWHWFESTGKPFKTATGEIRGVIASRDITERKQLGGGISKMDELEQKHGSKAEKSIINLSIATTPSVLWEGIRRTLESEKNIKIVAEASSYPGVISLIEQEKVDIMIVDTVLPKLNITEVLELTSKSKNRIEIKVILLYPSLDEETVLNAISLGCSGVLTYGASPAQVIKAIKAVSREEIWADRMTIAKVLTQLLPLRRNQLKFWSSTLTDREEEILKLIIKGYKNKQIAKKLYITENTLKTHISSIFKKLNINSRFQLISDFRTKGNSKKY